MYQALSELDTRYLRRRYIFSISSSHMRTESTLDSQMSSPMMKRERKGPGRRVTHLSGMQESAPCHLLHGHARRSPFKWKATPWTRARAPTTLRPKGGEFYVPVRPDGSWFSWVLVGSGTVGCCCPCTGTAPITALDTITNRSHDSAIFIVNSRVASLIHGTAATYFACRHTGTVSYRAPFFETSTHAWPATLAARRH